MDNIKKKKNYDKYISISASTTVSGKYAQDIAKEASTPISEEAQKRNDEASALWYKLRSS